MKNSFYHSLMHDNITLQDRKVAANFLLKSNIFTQSKKVKEFETLWSKWLGVKYSVFVNSGRFLFFAFGVILFCSSVFSEGIFNALLYLFTIFVFLGILRFPSWLPDSVWDFVEFAHRSTDFARGRD